MSDSTAKLEQTIERYLAGGQSFWEFHSAFMNLYLDPSVSDVEAEAFEPAYEFVYMGADGEVPSEDQAVGVLPESVLKARLAAFRSTIS
jgi:hypothetical protein